MNVLASRARTLPAPPHVVWRSLAEPHQPGARPWLRLVDDEVEPHVLRVEEPSLVVWSSLWPRRPDDEIHLEPRWAGRQTSLRFTLLSPDEVPDDSHLGHLRHRLNHLLFADLRSSYGQ